ATSSVNAGTNAGVSDVNSSGVSLSEAITLCPERSVPITTEYVIALLIACCAIVLSASSLVIILLS
ncbi:hypothetical protein P1I19_003999, partial [Proteus mirabilis]|nr:hypothetical protein [Proteus mirabilis]